jgi:hypothetical protein
MKKSIYLTIFVGFCYLTSFAQCEDLLRTARLYKDKGQYEAADNTYTLLEKQCPDLVDQTVRNEWSYCKSKVENRPDIQISSSGYVPSQPQKSDSVHNTTLYFDAEGNSLHNYRVTTDKAVSDVLIGEESADWLSVEVNGNEIEAKCKPNPYPSERNGEFTIILDRGTRFQTIQVQQNARKTSSVPVTRPHSPSRTVEEEQPVAVKITFSIRKEEPRFDENNEWKLLKALVENKDLVLQIEIPWCSDAYDVQLVQKRLDNITEHFIRSGIAKERIKRTYNEVYEADATCDEAFARVVKK